MSKVLLTRPEERNQPNDEIHTKLKTAGVEILQLPMVRFTTPRDARALDEAVRALAVGQFDLALLSSPTAVDFFLAKLEELGIHKSQLSDILFGAVGVATGARLELAGIHVRLPIPQQAGSQHLVAALQASGIQASSIQASGIQASGLDVRNALLLQSQIGLDQLQVGLEQLGIRVRRETLYETHGPSIADAARLLTLLENGSRPDVIAFFSPSSVHFFVRALAEMSSAALRGLPALAAIGETTAKAIEETLRKRPEIVARKSDQATLAEDILRYLKFPLNAI